MGFFENPEFEDAFNDELNNESICPLIDYPLGSLVLYCKSNNKFTFFHPTYTSEFDTSLYISVGVVLELLTDYSYIVMNKGFLNSEKLPLLNNLQLSKLGKNSSKYIASVIANEFKRYTNIFYNNCTIYAILKLELLLPSNRHMDLIMYNTELLISSLTKLIGEEKAKAFYLKLISERIYCNISGYIAEWKVPSKSPDFYKEPGIFGGYFLPIMQIKLK